MDPAAGFLTTARTLAVDGWAAQAVRALSEDGVPSILLKGPAIAAWLYDQAEPRPYGDADLLVAPETVPAAEASLTRIGYTLRDPEGEEHDMVSGPHAQTWARPDGAVVDLHHTLPGEVLADTVVWPELDDGHTRTITLAGTPVRVLDEPALALLVALHAGHHGAGHAVPLEDLRRAIAKAPDATWEQAAVIAERVMAVPQLVEGLNLFPEGERLAERIGLPDAEVLRRLALGAPSHTFARFAASHGVRARVQLLGRKLVPTPSFMRWWRPWAARGAVHLGVAYVYRLGWLTTQLVPGYRAWRRARS